MIPKSELSKLSREEANKNFSNYLKFHIAFIGTLSLASLFFEFVQRNVYDMPNGLYDLSEAMGHQDFMTGTLVCAVLEYIADLTIDVKFVDNKKTMRLATFFIIIFFAISYNLFQELDVSVFNYVDSTFYDIIASVGAVTIIALFRSFFSIEKDVLEEV